MGSIFDLYETREELLDTIESAIQETEDHQFLLAPAVDKSEKYSQEIEQSQKYRHRAQEAEAKIDEYEKTISVLKEQVKQHQEMAGHSEELQARIQDKIEENSRLVMENKDLRTKLEPLQTEIQGYKARETQRRIQSELTSAAKKLKIVPTAMRDVARMEPEFYIDEVDNLVKTRKEGMTPEQRLEIELSQSPHWLPPSEGGGSNPGNVATNNSREAQFQKARDAGNILEMVRTAPTASGTTHKK